MDELLILLRQKLGISSTIKDVSLLHSLESTQRMLDDEKGINADLTNPVITEFIVDYTAWKYERKPDADGMPRYLQAALNNLMIHNGKIAEVV